MPTFDHVNLGVPVGGMDTQVAFLIDILGYRRVDPGPEILAKGNPMWFESDDGGQVHLSMDPEHRPPERTSPCGSAPSSRRQASDSKPPATPATRSPSAATTGC